MIIEVNHTEHNQSEFKGKTPARQRWMHKAAQSKLNSCIHYFNEGETEFFNMYLSFYLEHLSKFHINGEAGSLLTVIK